MALQIDTSRALRLPYELGALVGAILEALPADELDWIEWKSGLDLSTKSAQGTIARHALGMANRQPDAAAAYLQGAATSSSVPSLATRRASFPLTCRS